MLMAKPSPGRQIAVVRRTQGTLRLAQRLAPHCASAVSNSPWPEGAARSWTWRA